MKFGRLSVIEYAGQNKQHNATWKCVCDCGRAIVVSSTNLLTGHSKSCGCLGMENSKKARVKDITGVRFGKLTALYISGVYRHQNVWHCSCECGNESDVPIANLMSGNSKSCGCTHRDVLISRNTTHGKTGTPEYNSARSKQRKERRKKLDTKWNYEIEHALRDFYKSCVVCGGHDNLQVDHVRPLSRGHGLSYDNCTILCGFHNQKKKAKLPEDLPDYMRIPILESSAKFKEYWLSLQST